MKSIHRLLCTVAVWGLSVLPSHASFVFFTDYNLNGVTAGWDIFYGANYLQTFTFETGTAGNPISSGPNLTLTVFNTAANWGPSGNQRATGPTGTDQTPIGDRETFYTFFSPEVQFSITSYVGAGETLTDFVLQGLRSLPANSDFSTVRLNGMAATLSGANLNDVQFWQWSGLNLTAGTELNLTWSLSTHTALDALQIQSNAMLVPEPSTYALLALGLGVLGFAFRRKLSGKS